MWRVSHKPLSRTIPPMIGNATVEFGDMTNVLPQRRRKRPATRRRTLADNAHGCSAVASGSGLPVGESKRNEMRLGIITIVAALAIAVCAAILGGCRHWQGGNAAPAIVMAASQAQSVSDPVIRAETRRQTIQREAETAEKAVSDRPAAAAPVATIKAEAKAQKDDLADAINKLEIAGNGYATALDKAKETEKALVHIKGQWYVKAGIAIERIGWWFTAVAGVFLIGCVIKDTALASGWGMVFVVAYKAIIGVLSLGLYYIGIALRALVKKYARTK
jgi:hypothetical protein